MRTSLKGTVTLRSSSLALAWKGLPVLAWIGLAAAASGAYVSGHIKIAAACGAVAVAPAAWYVLEHVKPATVFTLLCVTAWLPLAVPLPQMWVFELGVWVVLALQVTRLSVRGVRGREALRGVPVTGFGLLIAGALIGWAMGGAVTDELATIRVVCVLPLAILFLGRLCISRREDAVRALLVLVVTYAVLAVVFSFGPGRIPGVAFAAYGADTGRQAITIVLPSLLGTGQLEVLQAPAGTQFGFLLPFAFAFYALGTRRWVRTAGLASCLLFLWAIVIAQGRGGGIVGLAGVLFFTAATTLLRRERRWGVAAKAVGLVAVAVFGAWAWALQSANSQLVARLLALTKPTEDVNVQQRFRILGAASNTLGEWWVYGISLHGDVVGNGVFVHYSPFVFLVAFGVVGFIGVIALTVSLCVSMAKATLDDRTSEVFIVLLPAIWGVFSLALNHIWWYPWTVSLTWVPVALALAVAASSRTAGGRVAPGVRQTAGPMPR